MKPGRLGLVLLIEDSPTQAAEIAGMLAAAGWTVRAVRDYPDAYAHLPDVDAVVADFITPSQTAGGATWQLFALKCGRKPSTLLSWTDCGGLPHLSKADLPGCLLDWLAANVNVTK